MRTSYLWATFKPWSRYQDSWPRGCSGEAAATGNAFCRVEFAGDSVSRRSVCSGGPVSGSATMFGARKMTFSVFARAVVTCSANRTVRRPKSIMATTDWPVRSRSRRRSRSRSDT
jgi:hypothetical protein